MNWRVCQLDAFGLFYTVLKCQFLIKGLEISNQELYHEQLKKVVLIKNEHFTSGHKFITVFGAGHWPSTFVPTAGRMTA